MSDVRQEVDRLRCELEAFLRRRDGRDRSASNGRDPRVSVVRDGREILIRCSPTVAGGMLFALRADQERNRIEHALERLDELERRLDGVALDVDALREHVFA